MQTLCQSRFITRSGPNLLSVSHILIQSADPPSVMYYYTTQSRATVCQTYFSTVSKHTLRQPCLITVRKPYLTSVINRIMFVLEKEPRLRKAAAGYKTKGKISHRLLATLIINQTEMYGILSFKLHFFHSYFEDEIQSCDQCV